MARDGAMAGADADEGGRRRRRFCGAHEQAGRCVLRVLVWCRSRRTPLSLSPHSVEIIHWSFPYLWGAPNVATPPAFCADQILGAGDLLDARALGAFLAQCQYKFGGISKAPGEHPGESFSPSSFPSPLYYPSSPVKR